MITMVDETAILRYLLSDNAKQSEHAAAIVSTGQAYTYPEIITRVAVILRDVYRVPRSIIAQALTSLLEDINVAEEDVVKLAVRYFGTTSFDFTDCMLRARNALRGYKVLSFDKAFMRKMLP